jgi:hypothetical protein
MRSSCLRGGVLLVMLGALGCGGKTTIQPGDGERLGDRIDLSVQKWLGQSREELARQGEELAKIVTEQRRVAREEAQSVTLLPDLHPSPNTPVFSSASYSAEVGFSVPPYFKGGQDAELARHLARFGDHEAARKLGGSPDEGGKNYPVEWIRLVSLAQQSAELKLASGEPEGAAELAGLHSQLREVLDERAARGPLGAALLPVGRRALAQAGKAWKEDKASLAGDIETVLAEWGPVPDAEPALSFGTPRDRVGRFLGVAPSASSRTVAVREPEQIDHALDLLALPVPGEWVEAVVAFLDAGGRLTEVAVVYRSRIGRSYPQPGQLAQRLEERGYRVKGTASASGLTTRTCEHDGLTYHLTRVTRGQVVGGVVRVTGRTASGSVGEEQLRSLGAVRLDGSFGRQRFALAPRSSGDPVVVRAPDVLAGAFRPLGVPAPSELILTQVSGHDLLGPVTLRWPAERNQDAVPSLLLPLWATYGPSSVRSVKEEDGDALAFVWEAGDTRLRLLISHDGQSPELVLADTRTGAALAARAEETRRFDKTGRRTRVESGRADAHLLRSPGAVNGIDFSWLRLGLSRKQVLGGLPRATTIYRTDLPDGASLLFLDAPANRVEHWARQLVVRFDREGNLAEVRVRYRDRLNKPGRGVVPLLDVLTHRAGTSPVNEAAWQGLWADLPAQRPTPRGYRWSDDLTVLTCWRDAGGAEVVWRDRAAEESGALGPLRFCSRGVEGCGLGDTREAVLARWKVTRPTPGPEGSIVLDGAPSSPYPVLLVWFEDGKVSRVVARHREPWPVPASEVNQALQRVWSADLAHLGALRRQEPAQGLILGAFGWHDDVTRVRTYVQRGSKGPELLTEWRTWPVTSR